MTTEEKAKAYDEALEKARKINSGEGVEAPPDWTICEVIFPELKENEDERIRKAIMGLTYIDGIEPILIKCSVTAQDIRKYLEKQKINTEGDFGRGYDCGYKACLNSHGAEFFEKQKEQKPSINIDQLKSMMLQYLQEAANEKDDSDIEADTDKWARKILGYDFEQKSAEWSEEDEHRCKDAIYFLETAKKHYAGTSEIELTIDWLKSLSPQPHGNTARSR